MSGQLLDQISRLSHAEGPQRGHQGRITLIDHYQALNLSLGAVGDITASTDEDVDRIIGDVETDQLNVDKVLGAVDNGYYVDMILITDLLSDPDWSLLV